MADLITSARGKEFIPNFPSADDTILANIITACSETIERWTGRTFAQTTYDELYSGHGLRSLLLDHYPILSISRVATSPRGVLRVKNTSTANSRATVQVTSTGVTLTSVASGSTTTNSLAFATYTTLDSLVTAIEAISGWEAEAPTYGTWASADLRSLQGALNAKETDAWLSLHVDELSDYIIHDEVGELFKHSGWLRGHYNYRIVYSANYATVPEMVQQACAELVAQVYNARNQNSNLQSENLGGAYSYTIAATKGLDNLSLAAKQALSLYRSYRIPRWN